jgi:NAD(P)-dependent dehydrogenase (short-subunit alcohol dehydrogenase family)
MGRLQGKVAFITGAGSGIARAAAQLFALEGASVAIAELKPELGRSCEAARCRCDGRRPPPWSPKSNSARLDEDKRLFQRFDNTRVRGES